MITGDKVQAPFSKSEQDKGDISIYALKRKRAIIELSDHLLAKFCSATVHLHGLYQLPMLRTLTVASL